MLYWRAVRQVGSAHLSLVERRRDVDSRQIEQERLLNVVVDVRQVQHDQYLFHRQNRLTHRVSQSVLALSVNKPLTDQTRR